VFCPWIVAHHRLSALNRNSLTAWQRGIRNDIWTLVLHLPTRRLVLEISWKLLIGFWDGIRLGRSIAFFQTAWRCATGLGKPWGLRHPLSPIALRRYDALRFRSTISEADFRDPPPINFADLCGWWSRWRHRAREANRWQSESGGTGRSNIVRYAHEYPLLHTDGPTNGKGSSGKPSR